jgi:hypothetical protein
VIHGLRELLWANTSYLDLELRGCARMWRVGEDVLIYRGLGLKSIFSNTDLYLAAA